MCINSVCRTFRESTGGGSAEDTNSGRETVAARDWNIRRALNASSAVFDRPRFERVDVRTNRRPARASYLSVKSFNYYYCCVSVIVNKDKTFTECSFFYTWKKNRRRNAATSATRTPVTSVCAVDHKMILTKRQRSNRENSCPTTESSVERLPSRFTKKKKNDHGALCQSRKKGH